MARRLHLSLVASLVLLVVWSSTAWPAPGDLDPTFGGTGFVVTTFPGGGSFYGVALVGRSPVGCGQGQVVLLGARLPDGTPDSSFSGDGRLRIDPIGTGTSGLQSCTFLPDGRLLGVGWVGQGTSGRMLVAVFTPKGRPDRRFSGDGFATVRFPGRPGAFGYGVAVQPDGRIVVVGETYQQSGPRDDLFAIARLTPRGTLDRTFSDDGKATVRFGGGSDGAWKVAIDSKGRIVVAGWTRDVANAEYDSAVAVLRPNGKRDTRFGDGGKRIYDLANGDDYVNGLDLRPDDRIVLGVNLPGGPGHVVAQLRRSGGFDATFGGGDGLVEDVTPATTLRDLEIREGRIVFGGEWSDAPRFVRLRKGGGLDGTFGTGGVASLTSFSDTRIDDLTHDPKGRIVASGQDEGGPLLLRVRA